MDGLSAWVAIGNVGFYLADHVDGSLVELNKGTIVDLSQTDELENFSACWVQFVNTKEKI